MTVELQNLVLLDNTLQEIKRLKAEIGELPRRMAAIEAKLADAKSRVEAAKAAIKKEEQVRRSCESDIQDRNNKIIKFREQSSSVKTNEQYKALLHEIEFCEQEIAGFEEKILISMDAQDGLLKNVKAAEDELKADAAEIEKEKAHARAVTAEDEKKLAELTAQRDRLRSAIDSSTLHVYDRISAKRVPAIAEAREQKCSACNVMLRPQRYNELKSGTETLTCDSCQRILFFDPTHEQAPESGIRASARGDRAWFYIPDFDGRNVFAAFSNSKLQSSVRLFDAQSGELLRRNNKRNVTFREGFPDLLAKGVQLQALHHDFGDDDDALSPKLLEELQSQAGAAASH